MFFRSFFFQNSLFDILSSQGEDTDFHPDRAPGRNSDHRGSCRNASAGIEQGERTRPGNRLQQQPAAVWPCNAFLCR